MLTAGEIIVARWLQRHEVRLTPEEREDLIVSIDVVVGDVSEAATLRTLVRAAQHVLSK